MTTVTSCTARLVFAPETHVAFDRIATLLSDALASQNRPVSASHAVSSETLFLTTEDAVCCLEASRDENETLISLTVDSTGSDYRAKLARILYRMVKALPVTHLVWNDCARRLPRALFLDNLAPDCDAKTKAPSPRRVRRDPRRQSRPRLAGDALLARMLPVIDAARSVPMSDGRGGSRRDAYQQAHSRQMRAALTSPVAAREIIEIHAETNAQTSGEASDTTLSLTTLAHPAMLHSLARSGIGSSATISVALAAVFMLALGGSGAAETLLSSF
ncbi:hypothetical protein [Salipiger abyssi]|uniref:hypothetical protein n=1 Tax=Salipiger abyssi TaxID=1250539 RepID=UPI001A900765|nr:hypothetical protein [Salipiger abyssi]MBN9886633.1 hypothetical protein [Salipiger abyssi]